MMGYISPSSTKLGKHITALRQKERRIFMDKGAWLTDQSLDFLLGW
jgi:hypothetical protein